MEKNQKYTSNFSTLSINDVKTKKNKTVLLVQKYSTIAKTQQYLHNRLKGLQLY